MLAEPDKRFVSSDVRIDNNSENLKKKDNGIVLVPEPSDDLEDPLVSKTDNDPKQPS